ncbi:hypothetical protein SD1617_4373 [Shigella dysenteriae 1617]|nr:hypothetical protein SD1617_4373 [Shigella dysenteriae 1617]
MNDPHGFQQPGASLHPADAEQKSAPLQQHRKYPHVQKHSV